MCSKLVAIENKSVADLINNKISVTDKILNGEFSINRQKAKHYCSCADELGIYRNDQALNYIIKAVECDPYYYRSYELAIVLYVFSKEKGKIIKLFDDLILIDSKKPKAYYLRAKVYRNNNEAIIYNCTKAIELDNNYIDALVLRSQTYFDQNKYRLAFDDINNVIKYNKSLIGMYSIRGNYHYKLNNYDSALADFNLELSINNKEISIFNQRGRIFLDTGCYIDAINDFNTSISIYNDNYEKFGELTDESLVKTKLSQIINTLMPGALQGDLAEALFYRGLAFININNNEQGINDIKEAADIGLKEAVNYLDTLKSSL